MNSIFEIRNCSCVEQNVDIIVNAANRNLISGGGICGEHGGNPPTVEYCHRIGLTYVSCSPFRVPIARLAAAQAAIKYPR